MRADPMAAKGCDNLKAVIEIRSEYTKYRRSDTRTHQYDRGDNSNDQHFDRCLFDWPKERANKIRAEPKESGQAEDLDNRVSIHVDFR